MAGSGNVVESALFGADNDGAWRDRLLLHLHHVAPAPPSNLAAWQSWIASSLARLAMTLLILAPPERPGQFSPAREPVRAEQNDQQHDQRENDVPHAGRRADRGLTDLKADFDLPEQFGQDGDHDSARDRAGEASAAAYDQHRHDQEGEIEIKILDPHNAEEMRQQ